MVFRLFRKYNNGVNMNEIELIGIIEVPAELLNFSSRIRYTANEIKKLNELYFDDKSDALKNAITHLKCAYLDIKNLRKQGYPIKKECE